MGKRPDRRIAWAAAGAVACLIASLDVTSEAAHWFIELAWTELTGGTIDSRQDALLWVAILQKSVHVVLFGSMGLILGDLRGRRSGLGLAVGIALCVLAEAVQTLSATRSASWEDVGLNLVSFLAGFFFLAPLWRAWTGG